MQRAFFLARPTVLVRSSRDMPVVITEAGKELRETTTRETLKTTFVLNEFGGAAGVFLARLPVLRDLRWLQSAGIFLLL